MLLQIIESFPLLLNHVSMGEWEVVQFLHLFKYLFTENTIVPLVSQDLVGLNESQSLILLVVTLIFFLHQHHVSLKSDLTLLIVLLDYSLIHLTLFLLMNLVDNLIKQVIIVRSVKHYSLVESIKVLSVD